MEFIGSTIFSLSQSSPSDSSLKESAEGSTPKECLWGEGSDDLARVVNLFLKKSLPQLIQAAQGYDVQHVVICHSELPEDLRERLRSAAEQSPMFLYLERDDLIDPVNLSNEMAGFRLPSTPIFARYSLTPSDVVSLRYFDTLAKYSEPEYTGMRLNLLNGLDGFCISESTTIVREQDFPGSNAASVEILATGEVRPELLILAVPDPKVGRESSTVVDGSSYTHLSLHAGRTAALWKDPESEDFTSHQVEKRNQNSLLQDFPVLRDSMRFETRLQLPLSSYSAGDQLKVDFPFDVQSFTLLFTAASDEGIKSKDLIVSYELVDSQGNAIPADVELKGIGRISNPAVGHCFIPEISAGESRILKHVRPPAGVLCQGITFIRNQENDARIEIRDSEMIFELKQ